MSNLLQFFFYLKLEYKKTIYKSRTIRATYSDKVRRNKYAEIINHSKLLKLDLENGMINVIWKMFCQLD